MKNEGGSAFPIPVASSGLAIYETEHTGMTLRDYFAAKAMQGDWAAQNELTGEYTNFMKEEQYQLAAERFYRMADAMLKEREKRPPAPNASADPAELKRRSIAKRSGARMSTLSASKRYDRYDAAEEKAMHDHDDLNDNGLI
jgi:hypothetical protein